MATYAGQHRRPFIDTYEELTTTLHLKFLEYVKQLLDPKEPSSGTAEPGSGTAGSGHPPGIARTLHTAAPPTTGNVGQSTSPTGTSSGAGRKGKRDMDTVDGYPVMPEVDDKDLKEDLEDLLRRYLTAQYSE